MDNFRIEYNLHKDGSWVSDGFDTREEAEAVKPGYKFLC